MTRLDAEAIIIIPCGSCIMRDGCEAEPVINGDSDNAAVNALDDCPVYITQMEARAEANQTLNTPG